MGRLTIHGQRSEILGDLVDEIRREIPNLQIRFKENSRFHKFIGLLGRIFGNKRYMTDYTTVIGNTVWFPTARGYWDNPRLSATTLLHEWIHLHDRKQNPAWFTLSYLLLLPAVFTMRSHWEKRGYATNLMVYKTRKFSPDAVSEALRGVFCGGDYVFMYPFPKRLDRWVRETMKNPPTEYPYDRIANYVDRLWNYDDR